MLGVKNGYVKSVLYEQGYPIRKIGLRIPIPEYDPKPGQPPAPTPDLAYSSSIKNSVLFLEAKGGGNDSEQTKKFLFIQRRPETLLRIPNNNLEIHDTDLTIDFGIICTNLKKISDDHVREKIPFPVLHYNEKEGNLNATALTGVDFLNSDINKAFTTPIDIPRLPLVYVPFSSYDYPNNSAYFLKKTIMMIISRSAKLDRYERLPPLDEIVLEEYPFFKIVGKEEFHDLIKTIESIFKRLFPDSSDKSSFNINKYRTIRKNKIYLKRRSLTKFLSILESAVLDYQKFRKGTQQATLSPWIDIAHTPEVDICDGFDKIFDPLRFFPQKYDDE